MSAIRVHVHGAGGRMGSACVAALRAADGLELCGTSGRADDVETVFTRTRPDVLVEFTIAPAAPRAIRAALTAGVHVVSGTTGIDAGVVGSLGELARERSLGFLLAANFALGVLLMQRFARQAVRHFNDVEIIELHHENKRDAPSGTSLHTAAQIAAAASGPLNAERPPHVEARAGARGAAEQGVPIHSIRLPGLLAHQEVLFGGPGQVLTIRHDTLDRRAFMPGVLLAVRRIGTMTGLVDSLERLLDDGSP